MSSLNLPLHAREVVPPTNPHPGEVLLRDMPNSASLPSETDINQIVQYLDTTKISNVLDNSGVPFVSKDLKIGGARLWLQRGPEGGSRPQDTRLAAEHFDRETKTLAHQFVRYDARIEQRTRFPHNYIKIKGIRRQFFSFQLYAAVWMLLQVRGHRRGFILADYMGLGKVITDPRWRKRQGEADISSSDNHHLFVSLL